MYTEATQPHSPGKCISRFIAPPPPFLKRPSREEKRRFHAKWGSSFLTTPRGGWHEYSTQGRTLAVAAGCCQAEPLSSEPEEDK